MPSQESWDHLLNKLKKYCSRGFPNAFWFDRELFNLHEKDPETLKLSKKLGLPPQKLFIRYGLYGVCYFLLEKFKVSFPQDIYSEEENRRCALDLLSKIKEKFPRKDDLDLLVYYLKPYKTKDKRLKALLENL